MEDSTVVGNSIDEAAAEEPRDKTHLWDHDSSSNSSFASARSSFDFSSWRSSSSLSDAVTIQSEVSFGRHIGGGEIEEIPDYRWLPFSLSRRGPTPGTAPVNISTSSHPQAPARGRNTKGTKGKQNNRERVEPFRLFSVKEIQKATNNFAQRQVIDENYCYRLYKGTLPGFQQPVVIKRPRYWRYTGHIINEISILSRIHHRNIAKPIGISLEGEEHLHAVYEFCPNGTLLENIKSGTMPWEIRVKVATEIAQALMYLHSMLSDPIAHGRITPGSIHLDTDYTAKIFDFQEARYIPSYKNNFETEITHLSTHFFEARDDIDPEYIVTGQWKCKSDVYSFGVILAELLTGKPPVCYGSETTIMLAQLLVTHLKENTVEQIFDEEVANEDTLDEMKLIANIAVKCLEFKSEDRPSAAEIAMYLEQLKTPKSSTSVGDPVTPSMHGNVAQAQSDNSGSSSTWPVGTTNSVVPSKLLKWMHNRQNKKYQSIINKILNGCLERYKIYTIGELKLATNNFDGSNIIYEGDNIVYRGRLPDDKLCAIKMCRSYNGAEDILTEVDILSQLSHKNIVTLFGFCTEAKNPSTVHEYMGRGPLSRNIKQIPWKRRLKISCEVARALCYLHTSLSTPIIHGDVKDSNILLDDDYTAKLSDFGCALVFRMNNENPSPIRGTLGFIDPEYLHTGHVTCKSDVYSFGVVLARLLTGKEAIIEDDTGRKGLACHFKWWMEENLLDHVIDRKIVYEAFRDEIEVIANVAINCLSLNKEDRPSMIDVAMKLELLQSGRVNVEDIIDTTILSPVNSNFPINDDLCDDLELSDIDF